jgi:hypothetical protein
MREIGAKKRRRRHSPEMKVRVTLEAIYPKPRLSQGSPNHRVYPYLLRSALWRDPTKCGPAISPTSGCEQASFTWWQSWTGTRAQCYPASFPTRWLEHSVETFKEAPGKWFSYFTRKAFNFINNISLLIGFVIISLQPASIALLLSF